MLVFSRMSSVSLRLKKKSQKTHSGGEMDAIGKELEANRVILDEGIQDEEQWAQKVER